MTFVTQYLPAVCILALLAYDAGANSLELSAQQRSLAIDAEVVDAGDYYLGRTQK